MNGMPVVGYHGIMKVATTEQMREMDRRAIQELGVPGLVLMENAGTAVARHTEAVLRHTGARRVHVVCGTGNNGGDGLVAVRHLAAMGVPVTYAIAGDPERMREDAAANLAMARSLGIPTAAAIPPDAVVVDALLGTGTGGAPRGAVAQAIEAILAAGRPVVAVDQPSGVDSDTGQVPGIAVTAEVTVTFGVPKPGLLLYPAARHVGRLVVDPIGMDWSKTGLELSLRWFDSTDARLAAPRRAEDAHKGAFGHVLIIGGSAGMTGAPVLAARGALRGGAGLVTVSTPRSIQPVVASHLTEAMYAPAPEDGRFTPQSLPSMSDALERATVICVGPGIGRHPATGEFVRLLLRECPLPAVVDADALWAIADAPEIVAERPAATVLTPHPGEAARLLSTETAAVQADRVQSARRLAARYRAVAILKGARTVVSDGTALPAATTAGSTPALPASIITTGNPGMATGGSGDVLTGLVGALMAQGVPAYDAACLAAYAHGRAGDLAAQRMGQTALAAGDIAETLAEVWKEIGT